LTGEQITMSMMSLDQDNTTCNAPKPQFLCVRTLADSMGPKGLKTLRMVAGVVVDGIEPIHSARVGVLCSWASIPPSPELLRETPSRADSDE